jgi:CRISPR-associated endonuclease/helicase Cas3
MAIRLRSHPHLYIDEHLAQVQAAVDAILARHSASIATDERCQQMRRIVQIHDLGKGSAQFQEYIAGPKHYRGRKLDKSHTPLSGLLGTLLAKADDWSPAETIAAVIAALGHHSRLFLVEDSVARFADDEIAAVLELQLRELDFSALEAATGLPVSNLKLPPRPWARAQDHLEACWEFLDQLNLSAKLRFRLEAQLVFSILLEADKALLAVKNPAQYLTRRQSDLGAELIVNHIRSLADTPLNAMRQLAQSEVLATANQNPQTKRFTITLPTGLGKTLAAAHWALTMRERIAIDGPSPKIILVLPFLSILDQTENVYRAFLPARENDSEVDTATMLPYHSLAERHYDETENDPSAADFFLDTWRSEIVVTTFDQFLLALFSRKSKHQMRFHNLCDAIVIMDEVQTLPCILWELLDKTLSELESFGNTHVLAMSATQPGFLNDARELVPQPETYFRQFGRYRLILNHHEPQPLEDFLAELPEYLSARTERRILFTLNTRRSARAVRDCLETAGFAPVYFISADVTPRDRLDQIEEIRRGESCYVVSTQCIEAGVDIDMEFVLRDFAPLDSLVQIAGRCNRNGRLPRADVEIRNFRDERGVAFNRMIYDKIHLDQTLAALEGKKEIMEEEVREVCASYFAGLKAHMNLGKSHLERFANWEELEPIRELLRGRELQQHEFIVAHFDEGLLDEIRKINPRIIPDRWDRRRAWRKLAGRLAALRVAIYVRPGFDPEDYADKIAELWILRPQFYERRKGLCLESQPTLHKNQLIC